MLRLVIADDEQNLIDLIKILLDWEGIALAGEAGDGIQALQLIADTRPDAAIVDIGMPGMDGLQLIEQVRALGIDTYFIIISGYQEFEYARRAIRYGVQDYLSKPVRKDELNGAIGRLRALVDERQAREQKQSAVEHALLTQKREQRQQLIAAAEAGGNVPSEAWEQAFAFPMTNAVVYGVQLGLLTILEKDLSDYAQLIGQVMREMRDCAERQNRKAEFISGAHLDGLLVAEGRSDDAALDDELLRCVRRCSYRYEQAEFTLGRAAAGAAHSLAQAIALARAALDCRIQCGSGLLLTAGEPLPALPERYEALLAQFGHCVIAADAEGCMGHLFDLLRAFQQEPGELQPLLYQLAGRVLRQLAVIDADGKNTKITDRLRACMCKVWCSHRFADISYALRECARQVIDLYLEWRNTQDDLPVRQIKQYIAAHFRENVSLEAVADVVHMSPVYLSTYFKNKTGENFSAYLTAVRMEEAKKLLKQGGLSLQEIAARVGYANYRHFSKLFTKTVGVKPVEFRRFYG